uniref:Uncharacterized protein n=1 Tax=Oryza nivara TaxID=4536 RepID=A0A0E0HWW0_ORYNI
METWEREREVRRLCITVGRGGYRLAGGAGGRVCRCAALCTNLCSNIGELEIGVSVIGETSKNTMIFTDFMNINNIAVVYFAEIFYGNSIPIQSVIQWLSAS